MERTRKKPKRDNKAAPDLTPMIDVTFLLLIFFILVTRFTVDERNHQVNLPDDEGFEQRDTIPKEQITIYCQWDPDAQANSYVVAIDARGRVPVPESYASLEELVIFPGDSAGDVMDKKSRYKRVFQSLVRTIEDYSTRSGANVQKLEVSFARDATRGASSGTAPWLFVSLAVDAAAQINQNREKAGAPELPLTFKFTDSLGVYD